MTPERFREALVVGAGVSGLTTALTLQRAGLPTRILTRNDPLDTTSSVAAAVWHPYRAYPVERVASWSHVSLDVFQELAQNPATGVVLRPFLELFREELPAAGWRLRLPDLARRTVEELTTVDGLPPLDPNVYHGAYSLTVPVAETPIYLPWLVERFEEAGGRVEVDPAGVDSLDALAAPDRLVVCCAGLEAGRLLGDDEVYPIRGQVVRVRHPEITTCVVDDASEDLPIYVLPRVHDVIVGGIAEEGVWDLTVDPKVTERILTRAARLVPAVAEAELLGARTGLRPGRSAVRVERREAPGGTVIHNYGHGGSGFTLSWGCAREVLTLAGLSAA